MTVTPQSNQRFLDSKSFNLLNEQSQDLIQTWENQFSHELVFLNKIYKEEDKFSGIGNNFDFKVIVFYDKYQ